MSILGQDFLYWSKRAILISLSLEHRNNKCCSSSLSETLTALQYIEDIYFFEVNNKYISTSAVKKIARDEIYLVFAKKSKFSFISYSTEIQKAQLNFFLGRFSFDLTFAQCLLGKTLGVNIVCT